jgi:hypothetical protein
VRRFFLLLFLTTTGCDCVPTREDFVLVPDLVEPSGSCAGTPETLELAFAVHWANGERAQPTEVVVDAHVNIVDAATEEIVGPRILHEPDEAFDGMLDPGETVTIHYTATLESPGFGCAAVCAGDVVLQLLYGIDYEADPTPPLPNTEVRSDAFSLDCG